MRKMYNYLISYHHSFGLGSVVIKRNKKIDSVAQIMEVRSDIERNNKVHNVGIISYQLICKGDL